LTSRPYTRIACFTRNSSAGLSSANRTVGSLPGISGSLRERKEERGAFTWFRLYPDSASIQPCKVAAKCQPQSVPRILPVCVKSLEQSKNPGLILRFDANAVVLHREHPL